MGVWHWGQRLLKRGQLPLTARTPLNAMFGLACAQVLLGISTLLTLVPVSLGSLHQVTHLHLPLL